MKYRIFISLFLVLLALGLLGSSVYLGFFSGKECKDYSCFSTIMSKCKQGTYLSDEPEGVWYFTVKGKEKRDCEIGVKLLHVRQGKSGMEMLEGYSMDCYYPLGEAAYPQKDLSRCHGRLKEEFQALIIQKMHTTLLENIGNLGVALNLTR